MDTTTKAVLELNDACALLTSAQKTIENEGFATDIERINMLNAQTAILNVMTELANRYQIVAQKSTGI
jgi:hypothetical protein